MKKRKSWLIVIMAVLLCLPFVQYASAYTDVARHWGKEYIEWADGEGLFPQSSSLFRPDVAITRGDFLIALGELLYGSQLYQAVDFIQAHEQLPYQDVEEGTVLHYNLYDLNIMINHYARTQIRLTDIFPGQQLNPQARLTRYEAALLARALTTAPINNTNRQYRDVASSLSYYAEIMELVNNGIMQGYGDGTLRLNNTVTRAEAAVILKRINGDTSYFSASGLTYSPVNLTDSGRQQPVFALAQGTTEGNRQNSRFINAITTLEYIKFIGYIPYNEAHLYDAAPIETLWQLKNESYSNVVGNNYYLLLYDDSLQQLRKTELAKEAMLHLTTHANQSMEGVSLFLQEYKMYVGVGEAAEALMALSQRSTNPDIKLAVELALAQLHYEQGQLVQAAQRYRVALEGTPVTQTPAQALTNYAFLMSAAQGNEVAVTNLRQLNQRYLGQTGYANSELERQMTGLLKALLTR